MGVVGLIILSMKYRSKSEREYDKKLKESLRDEYIIDPETGAKLTLEQAESGHWVAHDNEFRTTPEEDIQKLFTEEQKEAERVVNHLARETRYRRSKFPEEQIAILENTKTLSKYDNWSYSNCYRIEGRNGFVFMPAANIQGQTYYEDDYHESQLMFWITTETDLGHYYFREKTGSEKFLDKLRSDDVIKVKDYESFAFKESDSPVRMLQLLKRLEKVQGFEMEFMDTHIFLKSTKLVNLKDLRIMEDIVAQI